MTSLKEISHHIYFGVMITGHNWKKLNLEVVGGREMVTVEKVTFKN